jgi:hypothetical protein
MPEETNSIQSSKFTMEKSLRKGIPIQKSPEIIYEESSFQGEGASLKPVAQTETGKPVANTPGNNSQQQSDLTEMYMDYSTLLDKINEVAFIPQKVRYQFEELRTEFMTQITTIKLTLESKLKEVDTYIQAF